jgi:HK97 family phage major capsid protein
LQVVGDGLVRDLRRKIDSAYFGNTVTNGPNGLGSLTTSTAPNGGTWANLDAFEAAKSAAENLHTQITAFVTSPATALALSTLKEYGAAGSNKSLLQPDPTAPVPRSISGVPLYVSPAVGADLVWAIPQQHTLFVLRTDASVVTDSSVMFTSDRVAVRATMRIGFGFSYPLAVVKISKT